jgi:3D (Asp-Asp-Asp) domain-containing protein
MYQNIYKMVVLLSILTITAPAKETYIYTDIIKVTATAYTSSTIETDSTPYLAAWRNQLSPTVPSIAVSRDLLDIGLTNGMKVRIKGLKGEFLVLDKMNKRWKNKIDIYMGNDRQKALNWGKRKVEVYWIDPDYANAK